MYAEEIYTAASAICGEESELLGLLATAAEEELAYRINSDVSITDIEALFITAAAMLAASMFEGVRDGQSVKAYSAGDVSVTYSENNASDKLCELLRDRAEALLAGYISDSGFSFAGVDG